MTLGVSLDCITEWTVLRALKTWANAPRTGMEDNLMMSWILEAMDDNMLCFDRATKMTFKKELDSERIHSS
jgi:hypothetical protein